MIPSDLDVWLEENAEHLLDSYPDETQPLPNGWVRSNHAVAHYGGEDQGSAYWTVWQFENPATGESVLIRVDGWYQSYNGAEYDRYREVTARQRTIMEYE